MDRDKASTMGVTAQGISQRQVEEAFWNAYATRQVSTINTPNNQYQVIVEFDPKFQNDPSALSMLYIRSSNGQNSTAQPMVPLGALASLKYTVGPLVGQSLRPAAFGDHLIQLARRGVLGRRCRPDQ